MTTWASNLGKGVDDLIVNQGVVAWEEAYKNALPLEHWQIWQQLEGRLTYPSTLKVENKDMSTWELKNIPERGIVAILSSKGTGKTKLIAKQVEGLGRFLVGGHRTAQQYY